MQTNGSLAPARTRPGERIGLCAYTSNLGWKAAKENRGYKFRDALSFLEYAHSIHARSVQVGLPQPDLQQAKRLRNRADELEMRIEYQLSLPQGDPALQLFERSLVSARESGARIARAAALSGRRYENFAQATDFADFRKKAEASLRLAEPLLRKHRIRLALENHKDWVIPELLEILRGLSSEWVGVCVDLGNNLAFLEDPYEVVEAFAPFALSVHLKDMAVQEYEEGFLLSEVPLGTGFLDLRRMISALTNANPQILFQLEMITRDPLRIPCLTEDYWATFGEMKAKQLGRAWARLKDNPAKEPLPRISGLSEEQQLELEHQNNAHCVAYAREKLGL